MNIGGGVRDFLNLMARVEQLGRFNNRWHRPIWRLIPYVEVKL